MKVLLELQKKQFDRGVNEVKRTLSGLASSIKSMAGMLVGGLGLSALVGQFKETAQQMSVVKATMENVSNGYLEYAENMQFVKRIAKEYGQDMLSLTNGFAKFHAAAKQTDLTLDQQRVIFEALTRASGAYHLSADQTSNVMMAVEQMMSKGKVAAEELRRQLGNALPGAFSMMAQAAGLAGITVNGTTAELEDAMKAGRVLAQDVLPAFAQVLNAVTSAANFDSLQSSLNRFKNAWAEFVDSSGFENVFKKLVDSGTNALSFLTNHFKSFVRAVVSILGGIVGGNIFQKLQTDGEKSLRGISAESQKLQKKINETKADIIGLNNELNRLWKTRSSGKGTYTRLLDKEEAKMFGITEEEWKQAKWADKRKQDKVITLNVLEQEKRLQASITSMTQRQKQLQAEYNKLIPVNALTKVQTGLVNAVKSFGAMLSGIASSIAFGAIIAAFTAIVSKIKESVDEAKRLKNMVRDTQAEAEKAASTVNEQIGRMNALVKIVQDTSNSERLRTNALKEINTLLGNQAFTMQEVETGADNVNTAIARWSDSLVKAARASAYFSQIQKLEAEKIDLETKRTAITSKPGYEQYASHPVMNGAGIKTPVGAMTDEGKQVADYTKKIDALDASINNLTDTMKREGLASPFTEDDVIVADMVKSALDGYSASLEQLKGKSISAKKYNRDVKKLKEDTIKLVEKYEGWEDAVESLGGAYEKLYGSLKTTTSVSTKKDGLVDALDKFSDAKKRLDQTYAEGKMSGDEYAKSLSNLVNKYKDDVFGMEDLTERLAKLPAKYRDIVDQLNASINQIKVWDELEEQLKEAQHRIEEQTERMLDTLTKFDELSAGGVPSQGKKQGRRNNRMDYRNSKATILGNAASDTEGYVDELTKLRDNLMKLDFSFDTDGTMRAFLDEVIKKLDEATKKAESLRDAEAFAQMSEDLKRVNKELGNIQWDAWDQGTIGSLQQIHGTMGQIMDDLERFSNVENPFEFIGATLDILGDFNSVVSTVIKSIETWNTVMETTAEKQRIEAEMTKLLSGQKVGALTAEGTAQVASATIAKTAEKAKRAEIAKTTAAYTGEAVAGAASSVSWLPVVGPALAVAAIASVVAAIMASSKKYATGGIVGGNSRTGDHNLIRANSGEMILNGGQQKNLWDIINGGGALGTGNVKFRIRGTDLIGVMDNERSRRRG